MLARGMAATTRGKKKARRKAGPAPRGSQAFEAALRAKAEAVRTKALAELRAAPRGRAKLRKLAKVVLDAVFTARERGAGSWSELVAREPLLFDMLVAVLRKSREVRIANGEVALRKNNRSDKTGSSSGKHSAAALREASKPLT